MIPLFALACAIALLGGTVVAGVAAPEVLAHWGIGVTHRHLLFPEDPVAVDGGSEVFMVDVEDGDLYELFVTSTLVLRGRITPEPTDENLRRALPLALDRFGVPVVAANYERQGAERVVVTATIAGGALANLHGEYRAFVQSHEVPSAVTLSEVATWGLAAGGALLAVWLWALLSVGKVSGSLRIDLAGAEGIRLMYRNAAQAVATPVLLVYPWLAILEVVPSPEEPPSTVLSPLRGLGPYLRDDGSLFLPTRTYEGSSYAVMLRLVHQLPADRTGIGLPAAQETEALELELIAPEVIDIQGSTTQRQALRMSALTYHWNCYFKASGEHQLTFVARVSTPSGGREIGHVVHSVKVVKWAGLSKRRAELLSAVGATITATLGIALALSKLVGNA